MSRTQPNFVLMADDAEARSPVEELRRRALRLLQQADETPETDPRPRHAGFGAPAAIGPIDPPPARALAVGVVTMPAVFVVVVLVALALFGKPAAGPENESEDGVEMLAQPEARPATGPAFASTAGFVDNGLGISEDSRIESVSLDGDRVAIHVESPSGAEIIIYDFIERRVIAATPIVTAALSTDVRLAYLTGAPPVANLSTIVPSTEPTIETKSASGPLAPRVKPNPVD